MGSYVDEPISDAVIERKLVELAKCVSSQFLEVLEEVDRYGVSLSGIW